MRQCSLRVAELAPRGWDGLGGPDPGNAEGSLGQGDRADEAGEGLGFQGDGVGLGTPDLGEPGDEVRLLFGRQMSPVDRVPLINASTCARRRTAAPGPFSVHPPRRRTEAALTKRNVNTSPAEAILRGRRLVGAFARASGSHVQANLPRTGKLERRCWDDYLCSWTKGHSKTEPRPWPTALR